MVYRVFTQCGSSFCFSFRDYDLVFTGLRIYLVICYLFK
jgi:hypothetical protein